EAAILIAVRLLDHALRLFEHLPQAEVLTGAAVIDRFILETMPHECFRWEAVKAVMAEFGVGERQVAKRLNALVKRRKLVRVPGKNGLYSRPSEPYSDVRVRAADLD